MSYARWATMDEVAKRVDGVNLETGVKKSGIPIGFDEEYLYIDTHEAHNLIIGSTGSGKTQSVILPMIKLAMLSGESLVINDPKGELYRSCALSFKEHGYQVLALDFEDAKLGNSWNPLQMPYQFYQNGEKDRATKYLEDIAYYLFFDANEKNSDPFWFHSVVDYFTGIALYLFEKASINEVHLESVSAFSNYLNKKNNGEKFLESLPASSKIYLNMVGTLLAPSDTRGSIVAFFNQKIKKYISRENLSNMLSGSDFDLEDLGFQPSVLFIISGVSNYCSNLIPLFIQQVVDAVDFRGKCSQCFHLLLDEFDSLVPIRDFSRMIENCRALNIRFTITIRSYVHLCSMYSRDEAEILRMCFGNLIYLLSDDIYTLEAFSKYCGTQLVDGELLPLITVEDLRTIGTFEGIVIMPRMMPYKTKFLPDYKIDWGMNFSESDIPSRVVVPSVLYDEEE